MTDTRKVEHQTPENKSKATGELKDSELDRATGGGMTSNVLKTIGNALQSVASKG